jgi:hypothetical protein
VVLVVSAAPNSFQVISLTKQYTFACESDKKRREWYNDCNEVRARICTWSGRQVGATRAHRRRRRRVLTLAHTGTQAINMMVMQQKTIAEKLAEAGTRPLMGTVRDQQ